MAIELTTAKVINIVCFGGCNAHKHTPHMDMNAGETNPNHHVKCKSSRVAPCRTVTAGVFLCAILLRLVKREKVSR